MLMSCTYNFRLQGCTVELPFLRQVNGQIRCVAVVLEGLGSGVQLVILSVEYFSLFDQIIIYVCIIV